MAGRRTAKVALAAKTQQELLLKKKNVYYPSKRIVSILLSVQNKQSGACSLPCYEELGCTEECSVFLLLFRAPRASARTVSQPPLGTHTARSLAAALRRVTQITISSGAGPAAAVWRPMVLSKETILTIHIESQKCEIKKIKKMKK